MRSFQQVVVFLFAIFTCALAQDSLSYDATVYVTSTVYRVNTVTMSGYATASVANSTSTIYSSSSASAYQPSYYPSANGTTAVYPSGTIAPSHSAPAFTGAASHMNVPAALAALAAGVGYLAL
jgi:hypothetical protein